MIAMRRLTIILLVFVAFNNLSAQKSEYSIGKIEWMNPWIPSSNASGMVLNDVFLDDIHSYTDGALSGYFSGGDLKNIYDPQMRYGGNFGIGSYLTLGKVYLKGAFEYDYSLSQNSTWRGWYDPYSTPFMLADSIPGNLSLEEYRMEAALAYPAGDHFSLGLDLKYNVGIMAKHKDLRNKNTIMRFDISPSVMYRGDSFNIGLNLGYTRRTEKVEYSQENTSSEKYLFTLYGLWLYTSSGFSSAETSRDNISSAYNGSVTADITFGSLRIFNDFCAEYQSAMQGETGYNNLLHGQTKTLTYSDRLTLLAGARHKIGLNLKFSTMTGDRFLQRQELDPQSNIRVWVTYGGPINYYYRNFRSEDLSYTYRHAKSYTDVKWEVTAGVKDMAVYHKYKETPYTFHQNLNTLEGYLMYTQHLEFRKSRLDISPAIRYSHSLVEMYDAEKVVDVQLEEPMMEEFNFWRSPKFTGGIDLEYSFKVLSVKGGYQGAVSTVGPLKGQARHQATLGLGFKF